MTHLKQQLAPLQQRIEQVLQMLLPSSDKLPAQLHEAMRYCALDGGKRMRPAFVYATGQALGVQESVLDIPAAALEVVHVYSLVHDDLPAMDDDDLRRGKATCHKQYDEATAILVGDALQALAFQWLASHPSLSVSPEQRLRMIQQLAQASGSLGMVGGQAIDLAAVGKPLTELELENMHIHKTGALIRASVLMAAYVVPNIDDVLLQKLDHYAKCVGLAFQVQDDILDIESDTQTLGKMRGADLAAGKPTYPSIIGMPAAKEKLQMLYREAIRSLEEFDERADLLRDMAEYTVKRLY